MSNNQYSGNYKGDYEYFLPVFFIAESDTDILKKAKAVNDMYDTYLYGYDVRLPQNLPAAMQEYLSERAHQLVPMGEHDE